MFILRKSMGVTREREEVNLKSIKMLYVKNF
jgi:hypothetical protein